MLWTGEVMSLNVAVWYMLISFVSCFYAVGGVRFGGIRADEGSIDCMVSTVTIIAASCLWTPDWKSVRAAPSKRWSRQPKLTLKYRQWSRSTDYPQWGSGLTVDLVGLTCVSLLQASENIHHGLNPCCSAHSLRTCDKSVTTGIVPKNGVHR